MDRAGLGREPGLKPASITAYAAQRVLAATGRIEDAARFLGYRSLDATAQLVGHDWVHQSEQLPGASRSDLAGRE